MAQIDQARSGPELERFDGDHQRANLSGLGPKRALPDYASSPVPEFLEAQIARSDKSAHSPNSKRRTANQFLSQIPGQPAKPSHSHR